METFTNLPQPISDAIASMLSSSDTGLLASRAKELHERYMRQEKVKDHTFIQAPSDVFAYLALRAPATYAQIYSALSQIKELVPNWNPKTLLDLGCGPGTGLWAATTVWPSIEKALGIDQDRSFLTAATQIYNTAHLPQDVSWRKQNIKEWIETDKTIKHDLIIVANVFNELSPEVFDRLIQQVRLRSCGIILILEPGTSRGYKIIQTISQKISQSDHLLAPYIHNNFVESNEYWIHFSQRFNRPEFQRRIRQSMRESTLMASDWEETKYSYVAYGTIEPVTPIWGRCIGSIYKSNGYLTLPILTEKEVVQLKVLKRHKLQYNFAKKLRWGEIIPNQEDIVFVQQPQ